MCERAVPHTSHPEAVGRNPYHKVGSVFINSHFANRKKGIIFVKFVDMNV